MSTEASSHTNIPYIDSRKTDKEAPVRYRLHQRLFILRKRQHATSDYHNYTELSTTIHSYCFANIAHKQIVFNDDNNDDDNDDDDNIVFLLRRITATLTSEALFNIYKILNSVGLLYLFKINVAKGG